VRLGRDAAPEDERDEGEHQKDEEQNLGDTNGAGRNATKTEDSSQKRDHEKYGSPTQHDENPLAWRGQGKAANPTFHLPANPRFLLTASGRLNDDLDTTVVRAAFRRIVVGDRARRTKALRNDTVASDAS
jgi:hypothetical protein